MLSWKYYLLLFTPYDCHQTSSNCVTLMSKLSSAVMSEKMSFSVGFELR